MSRSRRGLEVVELVGEERVAFLERRELLEGQRVHLAEPVELALRSAARCSATARSNRDGPGWGRLVADHRHGHLGAVLRDQRVRLDPELIQGVLGELPRGAAGARRGRSRCRARC